jgi:carboxylesterase
MRWMGEYLSKQSYRFLGVRLLGHATRPADMIRSSFTDWIASVEEGYQLLRGLANHVYLIGLSMGGVLSLLMSTQLDVRGVLGISTPYRLSEDWRLNFIGFLRLFKLYLPKVKLSVNSGWFNQEARKDNISYSQNSVRSIGELNKLTVQMKADLPHVKAPVLLMHSKEDKNVLPENLKLIYRGLVNTHNKTKLYIANSGHVITRDAERGQVFKTVAEFISRIEALSE